MGKFLAKIIYRLFYWLDIKLGYIKDYDYETAPYCGHHYNGHAGKFTRSSYHEGMGGADLNTKNPFLKIGHHSEEGWYWAAPCIKTTRELYYKNERVSNSKDEFYTIRGVINCYKSTKKAKAAGVTAKIKYSLC